VEHALNAALAAIDATYAIESVHAFNADPDVTPAEAADVVVPHDAAAPGG
jgi:hypothetical protein